MKNLMYQQNQNLIALTWQMSIHRIAIVISVSQSKKFVLNKNIQVVEKENNIYSGLKNIGITTTSGARKCNITVNTGRQTTLIDTCKPHPEFGNSNFGKKCFCKEIKILHKWSLRKVLYMYFSRFIECKLMSSHDYKVQT